MTIPTAVRQVPLLFSRQETVTAPYTWSDADARLLCLISSCNLLNSTSSDVIFFKGRPAQSRCVSPPQAVTYSTMLVAYASSLC